MKRLLFCGLFLLAASVANAEVVCSSSVLNACSGSGGGSVTSGTTPISGGADTQVCFNDTATLSCGDSGLTFAETANTLSVLGNLELGHATANTLSASSGVLSVEGKALLDVSSSQTITAGTKDFEGGTFSVSSTGSGTPAYLDVPALSALTGADNICIGTASCAAATTANQNVVIGSNAGDGATTGMTTSVLIGYNAGTGSNIGGNNVAVGARALDATTNTTAASNIAIGTDACGSVTTGANNTCIGNGAGGSNVTTGNANTFIGLSAGASSNVSESVAIGQNATVTASQQMAVGGDTREVTDVYWSEGVTNASPLDVTHNATGGSGTDTIGADLRLAGGKGTGAGAGGDLVGLTSPALATGTTAQTLEVRSQIVAKQFTLTDNTAATFAVMTLGNDTGGGATVDFCIKAKDATDEQMECGSVYFAGIDVTAGAGGETCATPTVVGTVEALSAGTLGVTFAQTTGTDLCNWRVTSDTSLTTTEHYIKFSISHNSGQAITPQ